MFHTVRNTPHSPEHTFLVSDRGLSIVTANGERVLIPLPDVREVRLWSTSANCCRCVISTRTQRFELTNRHCLRRGEFQDRSETFTGFLKVLHERLQPYAASVRFTQGNRLPRVALVMFLLLPLLYVAGLLAYSQNPAPRMWTLIPVLLFLPISLMGTLLPLMRNTRRGSRRIPGIPGSSLRDLPPHGPA
jgi:hypothetical protein